MLISRLVCSLALNSTICCGLLIAAGAPQILPVVTQRVPAGGIQPQLVSDPAGKLHLLYFAGEPAHGNLYYTTSADAGKTWASPLRVNSELETAVATGTIRGGQLAVGNSGRVHVVWNGSAKAHATANGAPLLYARLNDARTAFEPERNLMHSTSDLDGGGSIAADTTGHVYVTWHADASGGPRGEATRKVWVVTSENEGKTFSPERAASGGDTGACGCCGMAIYSDSKGVVRSLYRSATGNVHRDMYLLTSNDQARTFTPRKLDTWNINACPMSSMSFAEADGKVEGAWETGGQVYFQNLIAGGAKPVSASEGKSHKHPRLAIAPGGQTLLVWTDGIGWNRGGSAAWRVYDSGEAPGTQQGTIANIPKWSFAAVAATSEGFLVLY